MHCQRSQPSSCLRVCWATQPRRVSTSALFQLCPAPLLPPDVNGHPDIYRYRIATQTYDLVSVSSGGALGNDGSYGASLSSDGSRVAFRSDSTNLVSGDTNWVRDVFVKHL